MTAPPLPNSYWVLPERLLAGEYPGARDASSARTRVKQLLDAGIDCFVNLTMANELPPYDGLLPPTVQHVRRPITDHGLPANPEQMTEILRVIGGALAEGRRIYVHCRAGIGRTGTTIGCLLVERGASGEAALLELNRLWRQSLRSEVWEQVPETAQQASFILKWQPRLALAAEPPREAPDPLLEPETLAAAGTLRSRFLGALLGLATGDALAAATLYRRPGSFTPVADMLGGGPFDLPRGAWSDDTAMALCVGESLTECGTFNARDQLSRLARWQQEGHLSATGQCLGITAATARALAAADDGDSAPAGSTTDRSDPEPLARVVPVVMFYLPTAHDYIERAGDVARTTCTAPRVVEACRAYGTMLHAALNGAPKERVVASAAELTPPPATDTIERVLQGACWAFARTDNFRDAVLAAVNLGGNSDVVGAACGALAGAFHGAAAIPAVWRNSLIRMDLLVDCADRLLVHALVGLSG